MNGEDRSLAYNFQIGEIIPEIQRKLDWNVDDLCAVADLHSTGRDMATAAVVELRHIRTAAIDDPERVVQIGRSILGKGGYGSAGDECATHYVCSADIQTGQSWTKLPWQH